MKRLLGIAGFALVAGITLPLQGQQIHPNVATGTRTESLYADSGSDQVNLFNGNLSYSLPIGEPIPVGPILRIAPRLVYNSQIWKTWQVLCGSPPYYDQANIVGALTGDRAFGAGWQLHFGRLIAPPFGESFQLPGSCSVKAQRLPAGTQAASAGEAGMWSAGFAYLSPDGSVHEFYDRQFEEETPLPGLPPTTGWACRNSALRTPGEHCFGYTHDGSYLRLDPLDPEHSESPVVYFPDGTIQVLDFAGGRVAPNLDSSFPGQDAESYLAFSNEPISRVLSTGLVEQGPWNTTTILDPAGNSISVAYYGQGVGSCRITGVCAPAHPLSSLPDRRRDAIVWSAWDSALPTQRYVQVNAAAASLSGVAQPVVTSISTLSSQLDAGGNPVRATWTPSLGDSGGGFFRLAQLSMPLGLTLAATYQDHSIPSVTPPDVLTSVVLPTGGRIEWDYGQITFYQKQSHECPGSCAFVFAQSNRVGVVKRRTVRRLVPFGGSPTTETAETQYVRSYDSPQQGCQSGSCPGYQMRVDVWSPGAGTELRTVTRSRFHESDGIFKGALYGRPMWSQDYRVGAGVTPGPEVLVGITPFRTTAFTYAFDGPKSGTDPSAPGFEHNTRTLKTTTTWQGGRTMVEHHLLADGATPAWHPQTGHWTRTVHVETVPGSSPVVLKQVVETWLTTPQNAPNAWNLGLLDSRTTSRPAQAGDPSGSNVTTTETFAYDAYTGLRFGESVVSDNSGDTRIFARTLTRGTQASAPCLKNGAASTACSNRGQVVSELERLNGSLNGNSVSSSLTRSYYYKYGTLAAAHDNVGFYAVDRDVTATGRVVGERGPEGRTSLTDDNPQLTTVTKYDLLGRVVSVQPPGEVAEELTWGLQDVLRQRTVAPGNIEQSQTFFDQLGRPTAEKKLLPDGTWACRFTVLDAAGRRTEQTEWWKNGDPGMGSLCDSPQDAQGRVSSDQPNPSTPRGTSLWGFDPLDRPTQTRLADGSAIQDVFEGWWRQSTTRKFGIADEAATTIVDRDALGQIVAVTEPAAKDANGVQVSPAETTSYWWDHAGRLIKAAKTADPGTANAVTQTRTRKYDDFGWLLSQADPEKPVLDVRSRNARGLPLKTWDGQTEVVQTYDSAGRLLNSKRTGETPGYSMNGTTGTWYEVFTYDAMSGFDFGRSNGRLVWSLRANHANTNWATTDLGWFGITDYFHYNGLGGRLGFRQQSDMLMPEPALPAPQGVAAASATKKSPFADALRNYFTKQGRAAKTDADLVKAAASPTAAKAMALVSPSAPSGPARWSYTWDSAGRLSAMTYPRRDEGYATQVAYGYDAGYLTSVTATFQDPFAAGTVGTVSADLDYDASGRASGTTVFTSASSPNASVRITSGRDGSGLSRPGAWELARWDPSLGQWSTAEHRDYTYDHSGNIRLIGSSLTDRVASYTYDARGRLTGDSLGLQAPQYRRYDGFGNLFSVTGANGMSLPTSRATNRLDATLASYDAAGQMTDDASGRTPSASWNLGRDYYPDGALMAEFSHVPGSSSTVGGPGLSVWGMDARGEVSLTFWGDALRCDTEKFRSLVRGEDARLLTEYRGELRGPCSCEPDDVCVYLDRYYSDIVRLGPWAAAVYKRGTGIELEARDHLGTPRFVTNALGLEQKLVSLDSFGTKLSGTPDPSTRETFTGHERNHVSEDGPSLRVSDYMHARTYVPMLGRFTRPDPLVQGPQGALTQAGFRLMSPQTLNRYSYVLNNPIGFVDPDGLKDASVTVTAEDPLWEQYRRYKLFELAGDMRFLRSMSAHVVDRAAFGFVSGLGHVVVGAVNGDPEEVVEGLFEHSLLVLGEAGYLIGPEIKIGKNFRLAPFGNRTKHSLGELPHYHRRVGGPDGRTLPGGGIGRHRPWETPPAGASWWQFWRRF